MLEEILNALIDHQGKSNTEIADEKGLNYQQVRVLGYLRADRHITAAKIAKDEFGYGHSYLLNRGVSK